MLEGFERRPVAVGGAELHVAVGGAGPPVLLLHGYPQTHVVWHSVAPRLAGRFSLVMPDLPGYGASAGPAIDAEHVNYSKRAMGATMVELMAALGHSRFGLAGHDRGGRVGYRMALDHPDRVLKFAALDIIPTLSQWDRMDRAVAMGTFHWPFLAQPAPFPERLIAGDPDFFIRHLIERWAGRPEAIPAAAMAAYLQQFHDPAVVAATCEDYRAGATTDVADDRADRDAGRKIACPVLVVWGRGFLSAKTRSPVEVWRDWAEDVAEVALDCGHFVAEEEPDACAAALGDFFGG